MPELPEVEVVRLGLSPKVVGRVVRAVQVREHRLRWPVRADLHDQLAGFRLASLDRRGKYLLAGFGHGVLIVHLGMSGNWAFVAGDLPVQRHDHIDLLFDHGVLRFNDPRRFGAMVWHPLRDGAVTGNPLLARLGVEPLSDRFDAALLYRASRGRKVAIKQFLLMGMAVVGVGNIYASESLFRAGIRPGTAAGRLSRVRCERLVRAIRDTLGDAIAQGGTTLRDFAGADGQGGYFQLSCQVYGRGGEPCPVCGSAVRRSVQQQRATYWCAVCQS